MIPPRTSNPHKFLRDLNFYGTGKKHRNLRVSQSPGFGRPRRSRSQHWNPGGARCLSSTSVAQMLAAASIKVMDALFGFLARNDAEWTKRELLGRTWRRDWAMRKFQEKTRNPRYFPGSGQKSRNRENFSDWMLWEDVGGPYLGKNLADPGPRDALLKSKMYFASKSTPSPSQKLSRPPF